MTTAPITEGDLARFLQQDLTGRDGAAPIFWGGSLFRYDNERGVWYVWDEALCKQEIQKYHKGLHKVGAAKMRGTLDIFKVILFDDTFFDPQYASYGLGFADKFVMVSADGLTITNHSPTHKSRFGYPFPFAPGIKPKAFLKFLGEVWPEPDVTKIQVFQEFLGAALIGAAYQFEKAVFFRGKGSNGKSVLLSVLGELFPKASRTSVQPQKWCEDYFLAQLIHSKINIMADIPSTEMSDSAQFKAVVSGDEVSCRPIREAPINFRPTGAHVFSANDFPIVRNPDAAFWRRWLAFSFEVKFGAPSDETPEAKPLADKKMLERSLLDEKAAIVAWGLEGAARLLKQKSYTNSPSCAATLKSWKLAADQVASFIDEMFDLDNEGQIDALDLYQTYRTWTFERGHHRLAESRFRERVTSLRVGTLKQGVQTFYRLKEKT